MNTVPRPMSDGALSGVRDAVPMVVGILPFGLIFGTLAGPAGLPPWATLAMSALVYAGSAQFIAVTLLAAGASVPVILATTLIVNLRHMLYSATMSPHVSGLPRAWRAFLGFFLTDEAFALIYNRFSSPRGSVDRPRYYLGVALTLFLAWTGSTAVGVLLGNIVPGIQHWGLEFAMVASFVGIVVPQLKNRAQIGAALTAGIVALLAHGLPYQLGLMVAALTAVAVGVVLERPAEEAA
ncbi:AzlC family ABC transporter permease [Jeongeupia chitinilytica]|uniref:Branched-chain amino acid ABC transporter permease n=1 Tax=Jeongeupia chitinilytica TaxID=1041641 RepID=A0ABQ3H6E8_9NEIS|nr:AzlC family ABC transporter permease [Jeongeupia chitinilytica]GHD67239.1 branched-chain amino acid ABC transporter permease [Jeongeupia chitinilytica]